MPTVTYPFFNRGEKTPQVQDTRVINMDKIKQKIAGFKDGETGKTGAGGLAAEGKERYQDYSTDKKDGKVDWAKQGKDAIKDWKPSGGAAGGAPPPAQ
ncbi:hypothetical protein WJX73_006450 [Symbiochloris irregularis]|uniref:Uncharacterized protein n=1 Tax=Symbiochloris irregularis TaxID=706552 RepID=A0AAW1NMN0_9CHLO